MASRSDEGTNKADAPGEVNPFQTVLPGYPREYTEGLLPCPNVSEAIFADAGTPAYNWHDQEGITTEKPRENTQWTPIDPAKMYVSCLSWVAYPYGIPIDGQSCPYYRPRLSAIPSIAAAQQSFRDSSSSVSSESASESSSATLEYRPAEYQPEEPAAGSPPIEYAPVQVPVQVPVNYSWTGL